MGFQVSVEGGVDSGARAVAERLLEGPLPEDSQMEWMGGLVERQLLSRARLDHQMAILGWLGLA